MDRHMRESLDRWLTTEPEWRVMDNDELNDWGMEFIKRVDTVVDSMPDSEINLKEGWMAGDWSDEIITLCRTIEPDITEEQLDWVEQFLSEI